MENVGYDKAMTRTYLAQNATNKTHEHVNAQVQEEINADDLGDQANLNVKVDEPDEVDLQNAINVLIKEEKKVEAEKKAKARAVVEAKKKAQLKKK